MSGNASNLIAILTALLHCAIRKLNVSMKLYIDDVLATTELPSPPEIAHRILKLVGDSSSSIDDLVETIRIDPAMCAKILKTANSAFFGRQFKVTSVRSAIPILGATLIRTLVLGFSLTQQSSCSRFGDCYRNIWRRALTQAVIAEMLSRKVPGADPDTYFIAGLIQDIGALAILRANPKDYSEYVVDKCGISNQHRLETARYGFSHIDVTVEFCKGWSLDPETIQAIKEHHSPLPLLRTTKASPLSLALKLASRLAEAFNDEKEEHLAVPRLVLECNFNMTSSQLSDFSQVVKRRLKEVSGVFAVAPDSLPSPTDLLSEAKLAIEEIAIQSQFEVAAAKTEVSLARRDLEDVENWTRKLEKDIYIDPLTGAFNRRILESGLKSEIDRCLSAQKPLSILFIDVDNFKSLNDVCGHEFGDQALTQLVKVIRKSFREGDMIVRYGGDEFLVILSGVGGEELENAASRVCDQAKRFFCELTDKVDVSISAGGIVCPIAILNDLEVASLISVADEQMYLAKKTGGNRFVVKTLAGHSTS